MTSAIAETSPRTRVAELVRESPGVVPCTAALAVLVWFAGDEGGFRRVTWMPATLLLAAVLLVCLAVLPRPRPARLAVAAVLAYAATTPEVRTGVLVTVAASLAGMAAGRLVSAFDGPTAFYPNWFYCVVEAVAAAALFLTARP